MTASPESPARPRVVVLGGGFAGVGAVMKLEKADADVVLIDRHDYHTFQPLLYQLATGLLETSAVGHSLRYLVHDQDNVTIHKTSVTAIDLDARRVQLEEMAPLTYDYLVLGLGAEVNFFGTDGAAEHAFPMYTLTDSVRLKEHVLERWEAADKDPSLVEDGALNVVVVGGGPTGVESAGAIAELYRGDFAKDYPSVSQESARVVLVEAGPEVFSMFKPNLRAYTEEALRKRTVEVLTDRAEELTDGRSGAVRLQGVLVRPLLDEHERSVRLVQRVQLAAGFLVDRLDGLLAGVPHRVDGFGFGGHGGDDDNCIWLGH